MPYPLVSAPTAIPWEATAFHYDQLLATPHKSSLLTLFPHTASVNARLNPQVGMFGDVEVYQRQLDRIAGILDGDDEDAMGDLVQGEQGVFCTGCCSPHHHVEVFADGMYGFLWGFQYHPANIEDRDRLKLRKGWQEPHGLAG